MSFLSKLIECVIANQLQLHLSSNGLISEYQSAYRKFHSSETALLRIQGDILVSLDSGYSTALFLLDFSAAFDTIDHNILLHRLKYWFSITSSTLLSLSSFLANRFQTVVAFNSKSQPILLEFGISQDSVLKPFLYSLYTTPLHSIISKYPRIHCHFYADDTQIYISFFLEHASSAVSIIMSCIKDVFSWLEANKLSAYSNKTKYLLFNSKNINPQVININLDADIISPSYSAKNLGVLFQSDTSLDNHISSIIKSCFVQLRDFGYICSLISKTAAITIANSFIHSKIDYCNRLFCGLPNYSIHHLQKVQNTAVRIVTHTVRSSHITPVLKSLHWLPVNYCINFKIYCIIHRALSLHEPHYFSSLFSLRSNSHFLRSPFFSSLLLPYFNKKSRGFRSFSYAAPHLWNHLLNNICTVPTYMLFRKLIFLTKLFLLRLYPYLILLI